MMTRSFLAACAAVILLTPAAGHARAWIGTWGAAPEPPRAAAGRFPATPSYDNQTIREVVRIAAGGHRFRIRFTNEYGTKPLVVGAASIALADSKGGIAAESTRPLTFAGERSVTIPAGSPYLSDPVELDAKPLSKLSISLYLPQDTGPCTCHGVGLETTEVSGPGNFTDMPFTPKSTSRGRAFISGVEVETSGPAKTIVALGDSITDGVGSTADADRRWPDLLADRLAERKGRTEWGMVNMGISGNRVLNDGAGQSALARLDRDVLSVPGAAYVIVFEGVNDLGISYGRFTGPLAAAFKSQAAGGHVTAEQMIAGYRQIIDRAHERGLKIFGATIAPYEGAAYYSEEGEAVREKINQWIRTSGAFDAVLDFDAVMRDRADPKRIATPLQAGDHLHGSDAGYEAIARSIDLALFR
ncbi:MAG TPA: SGNH/GDSL hydrolase family protein [Steroidobacteraceae bacterium]|nr:SGNH/GDSL hydrolase family protein [Steroidobacteraceae bacterium]